MHISVYAHSFCPSREKQFISKLYCLLFFSVEYCVVWLCAMCNVCNVCSVTIFRRCVCATSPNPCMCTPVFVVVVSSKIHYRLAMCIWLRIQAEQKNTDKFIFLYSPHKIYNANATAIRHDFKLWCRMHICWQYAHTSVSRIQYITIYDFRVLSVI